MLKRFLRNSGVVAGLLMIVMVISLLPANVVSAAVALPELSGQWDQWVIFDNPQDPVGKSFYEEGEANPHSTDTQILRFGATNDSSLGNVAVDSTAKTVTFTDLNTNRMDIDVGGWTLVFAGESTLNEVVFETGQGTIQMASGAVLNVSGDIWGAVTLGADTTASKDVSGGSWESPITGPTKFTGASASPSGEAETPAATDEQSEAETPAATDEKSEAETPAATDEKSEAETPAAADEKSEAETPAATDEKSEAETPAATDEKSEAETPAATDEKSEAETPAATDEQTKTEDTSAAAETSAAAAPQPQTVSAASDNTNTSYRYGSVNASSPEGYLPVGGTITYGNPSASALAVANELITPIAGNAQKMVMELNLNDRDGAEVHQLGGYIQIAVPLPFVVAPGNRIAVYRVDGQSLTPCASYTTGDALVITTNHFSTYIFVETSESGAKPVGVTSPKTGDTPVDLILLGAMGAAIMVVCALRRQR